MGKRASKADLQFRLDTLRGLKAKGYNSSALIKAGQTAWNLSEREIQRYLKILKQQETEISQLHSSERFSQIQLRLDYLYAQAMAENNSAFALEVLKGQTQLEQIRNKTNPHGGQHANPSPTSAISLPESNELARLMGFCQNQKPASTG